MQEFLTQVASGLVVGFILGWIAKTYQMKVRAGRDAQSAQAEHGAAAARDGVAVGAMHGGIIDRQIGDRHYGREESPEEQQRREELRNRQRIFVLAVRILRTLAGEFFASPTRGHNGLPGYLWHEHEHDWFRICQSIGTFNGNNGRFTPHTEPNLFTGEDEHAANTARSILQWYLWGSENCPDFQDIQARYQLPAVIEVRQALDA